MKRLLLIWLGVFGCAQANAEDPVWFATDSDNLMFDCSVGQFSEGGSSAHLALQLPLINFSTLTLNYSRIREENAGEETADQQDYQTGSVSLHSDPWADFTFGLTYSHAEGQYGEQINSGIFSFGHNRGPWFMEASLLLGEDRFDRQYQRPRGGNSITVEDTRHRSGLGAALSYFSGKWNTALSYRDYVLLNDERSADMSTQQGLGQISSTRARRTPHLSSGIYQYLDAVSAHEAQAGVSTQLQHLHMNAGISRYQTLLDTQWINSLYISGRYPLSTRMDMGLLVSAMDDDTYYGEVGASLHW